MVGEQNSDANRPLRNASSRCSRTSGRTCAVWAPPSCRRAAGRRCDRSPGRRDWPPASTDVVRPAAPPVAAQRDLPPAMPSPGRQTSALARRRRPPCCAWPRALHRRASSRPVSRQSVRHGLDQLVVFRRRDQFRPSVSFSRPFSQRPITLRSDRLKSPRFAIFAGQHEERGVAQLLLFAERPLLIQVLDRPPLELILRRPALEAGRRRWWTGGASRPGGCAAPRARSASSQIGHEGDPLPDVLAASQRRPALRSRCAAARIAPGSAAPRASPGAGPRTGDTRPPRGRPAPSCRPAGCAD